jgi:hypothetical protein
VLTIKCAGCNRKLWKYDKIGPGEVLRCHKSRITRWYISIAASNKIKCICGKNVGIDKGRHIKMISGGFTYTGTKRNA